MVSIKLTHDESDDSRFVELVSRIIRGSVAIHHPAEVSVFKINHWFDHKWLAFSGKALGAVGIWNTKLTIPPFVANRVVDEWHFEFNAIGDTYQIVAGSSKLHHRGSSVENLNRYVDRIAPRSALFWFSGNTRVVDHASFMSYMPIEGSYWCWYLSFERKDGWIISRRKSIHQYELRMFQQAGELPAEAGNTSATLPFIAPADAPSRTPL